MSGGTTGGAADEYAFWGLAECHGHHVLVGAGVLRAALEVDQVSLAVWVPIDRLDEGAVAECVTRIEAFRPEELTVTENDRGEVIWDIDDRRYLSRDAMWSIEGSHAGIDLNLVLRASGARVDSAAGSVVPTTLEGSLASRDVRFVIMAGHGVHERLAAGRKRGLTLSFGTGPLQVCVEGTETGFAGTAWVGGEPFEATGEATEGRVELRWPRGNALLALATTGRCSYIRGEPDEPYAVTVELCTAGGTWTDADGTAFDVGRVPLLRVLYRPPA